MAITATGTEQQVYVETRTGARARRRLGPYLFLLPAIAYMCVTMLYPVYSNVRMSLHDVTVGTFLANNAPWIGFDNYRTLLNDPAFWKAVRLSLEFTAGSILFQFTIGFLLAQLFNQPFPGANVFRSLMLLGWLIPTVVSGSVFRWVLDGDYGVLNWALLKVGILDESRYWLIDPATALTGTIIANIWVGIPFNMLLILAGLQHIDPTLYEAAAIDGAAAWRRFWSITFPLMRPVSLSIIVLGFIYTFRVFDLIYVMTKGGPVDATTVLPIYTYKLTFQFFKFGQGAAGATMLLLGLLVVAFTYLWLSRREEVGG
jgi:multiple sugar transport system permease protein